MKSTEQENWWVLRAQTGDRDALNELLKAVQVPLFRYISSLVSQQHLAEDILQEVFLRIHRKLGWLRDPKLFRAWAFRVATNETFRRLKKEWRWSDHVWDEDALKIIAAAPPREEFAPEVIERLPQLLEDLSPASRAVIVLYYLNEMSFEDVSAALGIPVGTVKSRLAYGLESLRRRVRGTAGV